LKATQAGTAKNEARDTAEASVRSLVKKLNGNPAVDNNMRAQAGLPPHDLVKSAIGAPTLRVPLWTGLFGAGGALPT
jgi:RNA 3'-terminal phosphate cyclase